MAIDARDGTGIKTVQCKTARMLDGCITWWSASFSKETGQRSSYTGEVDYFGVWCPGLDAAYLVPVDQVASRQGRLRVLPPGDNQQAGIRWADEFLIKGL
jgi:PD-(D/E)XK endonuclease